MGSTCSSASEEVVEKPKQEDNVEKEAEVKQEDTVLNKVEKELPQPEPVIFCCHPFQQVFENKYFKKFIFRAQ